MTWMFMATSKSAETEPGVLVAPSTDRLVTVGVPVSCRAFHMIARSDGRNPPPSSMSAMSTLLSEGGGKLYTHATSLIQKKGSLLGAHMARLLGRLRCRSTSSPVSRRPILSGEEKGPFRCGPRLRLSKAGSATARWAIASSHDKLARLPLATEKAWGLSSDTDTTAKPLLSASRITAALSAALCTCTV